MDHSLRKGQGSGGLLHRSTDPPAMSSVIPPYQRSPLPLEKLPGPAGEELGARLAPVRLHHKSGDGGVAKGGSQSPRHPPRQGEGARIPPPVAVQGVEKRWAPGVHRKAGGEASPAMLA